eukprot:scaffold77373_cov33-Tisochrysis_lutea.AAC.1
MKWSPSSRLRLPIRAIRASSSRTSRRRLPPLRRPLGVWQRPIRHLHGDHGSTRYFTRPDSTCQGMCEHPIRTSAKGFAKV